MSVDRRRATPRALLAALLVLALAVPVGTDVAGAAAPRTVWPAGPADDGADDPRGEDEGSPEGPDADDPEAEWPEEWGDPGEWPELPFEPDDLPPEGPAEDAPVWTRATETDRARILARALP